MRKTGFLQEVELQLVGSLAWRGQERLKIIPTRLAFKPPPPMEVVRQMLFLRRPPPRHCRAMLTHFYSVKGITSKWNWSFGPDDAAMLWEASNLSGVCNEQH